MATVRLEGLRYLKKKKKTNDLTGNRTRDLLARRIVPQPTALPRAPISNEDDSVLRNKNHSGLYK
jgi:hypothetical protein